MLVVWAQLPSLADVHSLNQRVLPMLPAEQQQRIERHRHAADRHARVLVRALLVGAVRQLVGWDAAKTLANLYVEPQGRPYVRGLERSVSFSHAGQMVACALGPISATGVGILGVGVDIEQVLALSPHELAPALSEAELAAARAAINPQDALCAIWTTKEALLKARGTGFLTESHSVRTDISPSDGIYWKRLDAPLGYVLTVAGPWPLDTVRGQHFGTAEYMGAV